MVYSLVEEILMRENMTPHSFPYLEILNNLDIGIALFDAEGNYLFVNTELVNWRNIPMLEFLKMNVHDFLNILDVCVFDLVKKKNHRVSRLQYYKNKDHVDSKRRLRVVTGTRIFDENGKIIYVIMALQDVESFENLYQALLRQNQIVSFGSGKELVEGADIVAKSSSFRALLEVADNVASLDSTVLLYGESGSGKEILANYIHQRSDRREKPMITVNCAAFSDLLPAQTRKAKWGWWKRPMEVRYFWMRSTPCRSVFREKFSELWKKNRFRGSVPQKQKKLISA